MLPVAAQASRRQRGRAGAGLRRPQQISPVDLAARGTYKNARQRPTLPSGYPDSTIGAGGLNYRVRNGNGCLPSAMVTEHGNSIKSRATRCWPVGLPHPPPSAGTSPRAGKSLLSGAAAPSSEALDLAGLRRRHVVRTAPHLAHEPLLLHLAAEFPKGLLELLGVLDDYSHNPTRIPIRGGRCSVKPYSRTSGHTVRPTATAAKMSANIPITVSACVPSTGSSGAAKAARAWCPGSIRFKTTFRLGPSR